MTKSQQRAKAALQKANSGEVEVLPPPVKVSISPDQKSELNEHVEQIGELNTRIGQKMTDLKYDVIELGWRLLRSKEIVGHGNFENWASTTFSIHERTAQNYLNAAKNAGLTAKSKSETVSLLREKDKFKNKLLTDLYKSPKSKKETLLLPNPGNSVDKENSAARAAKAFQRIDDVLSETKILRCKFSAENTATLVTTLSEWLQVLTQRKIVLGEPV